MEIHTLNIDKYINWYSGITDAIDEAPNNREKSNRYSHVAYYLHTRYSDNKENQLSLKLYREFDKEGKKYASLVKSVSYFEMPAFTKLYRILSYQDWAMFHYSRKSFLETDIEWFEQHRKTTPLPDQAYIEFTIDKVKRDRPIKYLESYLNTHPLPHNATDTEFVYDINTIEFITYLYEEKQRLETGNQDAATSGKRLSWKADKKDISELIKALALTALAGTPETEIVKAFESIIEIKGRSLDLSRHEINKNELQDRKPSEYFTGKLNKAVSEFLREK